MALANYSDFKFENHPSIMEASRIIISEGSQPYRMVLRKLDEKEYVTHLETLALDGDTWKHTSFFQGHYFNVHSDSEEDKKATLTKAVEDYNERCGKL